MLAYFAKLIPENWILLYFLLPLLLSHGDAGQVLWVPCANTMKRNDTRPQKYILKGRMLCDWNNKVILKHKESSASSQNFIQFHHVNRSSPVNIDRSAAT